MMPTQSSDGGPPRAREADRSVTRGAPLKSAPGASTPTGGGRSIPCQRQKPVSSARLASDTSPNLLLMSYDKDRREVKNVCVVPKHFFVADIIERRKPLASTARRAGWVGSNILLDRVPEAGRIFVLRNGIQEPRDTVLSKWQHTRFLRDAGTEARGWLIEVMKSVEAIGRPEFDIEDVYAFEARLSALYPNNNNVKPKIRQKLQVLRDNNYLDFVGRGRYRLKTEG